MKNDEFTTQLAQMGQLEQLSTLNSRFERTMRLQEFSYARGLIGSRVAYASPVTGLPQSGEVTGARLYNGEVVLVVGADLVSLDAVTEIAAAPQETTD